MAIAGRPLPPPYYARLYSTPVGAGDSIVWFMGIYIRYKKDFYYYYLANKINKIKNPKNFPKKILFIFVFFYYFNYNAYKARAFLCLPGFRPRPGNSILYYNRYDYKLKRYILFYG